MALKPESVLDIGCGCGYTLWRIQQKLGFHNTKGLESDDGKCLRRVARNIAQCDLVQFPWPVTSQYDLAFTFFTLDRITDDFVPAFVEEMKKHTKRGLHFVGDANFDKWKKVLPDHEFVKYSEYIGTAAVNEFNRGVKKINFGCGNRMYLSGWINIDNQMAHDPKNYIFVLHDARQKLFDCPNNFVTAIVSHHMLNYLTPEEAKNLFEECWRCCTVGGFIRISIPDPQKLNTIPPDIYAASPEQKPDWRQGITKVYTVEEVMGLLTDAGFTQVQKAEFGKSISQTIQSETYDCYPQISLFIEARKLVL